MAGERVWLQVALLLLASVVGANADGKLIATVYLCSIDILVHGLF